MRVQKCRSNQNCESISWPALCFSGTGLSNTRTGQLESDQQVVMKRGFPEGPKLVCSIFMVGVTANLWACGEGSQATITFLPSLGGSVIQPYALNSAGQVTG